MKITKILGSEFARKYVAEDVVKNVKEYFIKENLSNYEIVDIVDRSEHPSDSYLFMIVARKRTMYGINYTVWTCWNESTKSLNYGHYDIVDIENCKNIVREFYRKLR